MVGKKYLVLLVLVLFLPISFAYECNFEGLATYNTQKERHTFVSVYNNNGFLLTAQKGEIYGQYKLVVDSEDLPIYFTLKDTLADDYEVKSCNPGINLFNVYVTDEDNDGFGIIEDCDDKNPNIFPKSVPVTKKDYKKECAVNGCIEAWTCTGWGDCIDGNVRRECIDQNNCNTFLNKPGETDSCSSIIISDEIKNPVKPQADQITGNLVYKAQPDYSILKKTFSVIFLTLSGVLVYSLIFKRK